MLTTIRIGLALTRIYPLTWETVFHLGFFYSFFRTALVFLCSIVSFYPLAFTHQVTAKLRLSQVTRQGTDRQVSLLGEIEARDVLFGCWKPTAFKATNPYCKYHFTAYELISLCFDSTTTKYRAYYPDFLISLLHLKQSFPATRTSAYHTVTT